MDDHDLSLLLARVRSGEAAVEDALGQLRRFPFTDLEFARVDHHRSLRTGLAEAVYAPGKTPEQCAAIVSDLLSGEVSPVLLTRADKDQVEATIERCGPGEMTPPRSNEVERVLLSWRHRAPRDGRILLLTAGTADLPVANECAGTLRAYGFQPSLVADCGVAGVHRLLAVIDELTSAEAIVVFAGMEGALASLVGGLSAAPVVAVPTSSGYGSSLEGITALLAMHASCAPGITVVGIDNGFGAACAVIRLFH